MKARKKHIEDIVKCVESHKDILFFSDILDHYHDLKESQFYNLKLNECEEIKSAINRNRATAKHHIRTKWIQSENPTLQIAAYRIMATEDERRALEMKYSDVKVNGNVGVVSEEAINNLIDTLERNGKTSSDA
ncbi:MAG: hypothetical protein PUF10_02780 [Bacteroidales bacterium]|nr:hypothetical protein [Bacteroidales bacterium]